ncbi:MAG: hypothetical protein KBS91_00430 [Firmicutes bacterium]|nr:hypothetical protein [Candidatus Caballimonas caccae]
MKLKKVNYLTEEKFTQLVKGEIEGKTYNPNQEQYLIELYDIVVETSGTMQTSTLPAMTVTYQRTSREYL